MREIISNMPLSGAELKKILANDFERLMREDGMLQDGMGFGRCAYEIRITLHTDNHLFPTTVSKTYSRAIARNVLQGGLRDEQGRISEPASQLAAIEKFPLESPSGEASFGATELARSINSPNVERLRNEIPVPVMVEDQSGSKHPETVKYPKDESLGDGDVSVQDVSIPAKVEWGQPLPPPERGLVRDAQAIVGDIVCHCGDTRNTHALSGICTRPGCDCQEFADARVPRPEAEAWPAPVPGKS